PANGPTPTSGSRFAVMAAPRTCSGGPDSDRFIAETRQAARSAKARVRRFQSKNVAGDTRFFGIPNAEKSSDTIARRSGSRYGSGRITVWSSALNTAALAPI